MGRDKSAVDISHQCLVSRASACTDSFCPEGHRKYVPSDSGVKTFFLHCFKVLWSTSIVCFLNVQAPVWVYGGLVSRETFLLETLASDKIFPQKELDGEAPIWCAVLCNNIPYTFSLVIFKFLLLFTSWKLYFDSHFLMKSLTHKGLLCISKPITGNIFSPTSPHLP